MQLKPGILLQGGKYEIKKVLGQGGFGITYLAEHTRLHSEVAIKEFFMKDYCNRDTVSSIVTVPSVGNDEFVSKFKVKFLKEAKMIADMDNRHIIKVIDVFEDNGTAYYVMEYLRCGSLTERIPESGLPETEALRYIRQIAEALSYIHNEKNVVHLDVKPSNIMFRNDDEAVLIDFGISKHYDDDGGRQTTITSSPAVLSRGYAPLEQYKPGGLSMFTPCTDVYSLGATLYKLLTGKNPPDANDVNEYGMPSLPASVSQPVRDAVKKAMSPLRKDRPQSIGEFLKLLPVIGGNTPRPKYGRWVIACLVACVVAMVCMLWPDKSMQQEHIDTLLITSDDVPVYEETMQVALNVINGHEYVDLGLSVKWATCNVGATSPEEFGGNYAWGEIVEKDEYSELNYKWNDVTKTPKSKYASYYIKKYNNDEDYGIVDNKYVLESSDDVATQTWGEEWRMPTYEEWNELRESCKWSWVEMNDVWGYEIKSKINENVIFLPVSNKDNIGHYWSSTLNSIQLSSFIANSVDFNSEAKMLNYYVGYRESGRSVRPVTK